MCSYNTLFGLHAEWKLWNGILQSNRCRQTLACSVCCSVCVCVFSGRRAVFLWVSCWNKWKGKFVRGERGRFLWWQTSVGSADKDCSCLYSWTPPLLLSLWLLVCILGGFFNVCAFKRLTSVADVWELTTSIWNRPTCGGGQLDGWSNSVPRDLSWLSVAKC